MSSRNGRLSKTGFQQAAKIYQILQKSASYFEHHDVQETIESVTKEIKAVPEFTLEYFTIADEQSLLPATSKDSKKKYRGFIVLHLEGVRLIDNIPLY